MWLKKAVDSIKRVVWPVSKGIQSVGLGVLAAMMFLTFADVFLRFVFNSPIRGAWDVTEFMMVILMSFGLAYCAQVKGHISVDLLVSRFKPRTQAIIEVITGLIALALIALIIWQAFLNAITAYNDKLVTSVTNVPVFPFAALCGFGFAVLWLVFLIDFLESLSKAVSK